MGIETLDFEGARAAGYVELPRAVWELKHPETLCLFRYTWVELPRAVWELKLLELLMLYPEYLLNSHAQYGN